MKKQISIKCGCTCKVLIIEKADWGDLYFEVYENKFYTKQCGIFTVLKERIKSAFNALIGEDYLLFDIFVNSNQTKEVIADLKKFIEECESE
jgi:hypothetical protein